MVGVVLGAGWGAYRHGEFHLHPARQPIRYFIFGFLMINFGLILGSCPIRIVLLSAYGSVMGVFGWALVVIGVGVALVALRWNANRSA